MIDSLLSTLASRRNRPARISGHQTLDEQRSCSDRFRPRPHPLSRIQRLDSSRSGYGQYSRLIDMGAHAHLLSCVHNRWGSRFRSLLFARSLAGSPSPHGRCATRHCRVFNVTSSHIALHLHRLIEAHSARWIAPAEVRYYRRIARQPCPRRNSA